MNMEKVSLSSIKCLDNNPRYIREEKFAKLVTSILVFPKMLELRPIVIDESNTILGGNMRFRALCEIAKYKMSKIEGVLNASSTYNKVEEFEKLELRQYWQEWLTDQQVGVYRASGLTEDEKKEFVIKDNVGFGDWDFDMLANEFDEDMLSDVGLAAFDTSLSNLLDEAKFDSFIDAAKEKGSAQITFVMKQEEISLIKNYIKANGKDILFSKIIEICRQ